MKKLMILAGAALLALAACNKSETVVKEDVQQISFKTFAGSMTKGAELTGEYLPATWGIYAAATQRSSAYGIENPNFFGSTEQLFSTAAAGADAEWKASPAVYWPLGGVRMDFLAYAMIQTEHDAAVAGDWKVVFDNPSKDAASQFTVTDVDTYDKQRDFLYAAANDQTSAVNAGTGKSVHLIFNHAQALLIFNVKRNNVTLPTGGLKINEIAFYTDDYVQDELVANQAAYVKWVADGAAAGYDVSVPANVTAWEADGSANPAYYAQPEADDPTVADITLKTIGTFTVNNERNKLIATWAFADPGAIEDDNFAMPNVPNASTAHSTANTITGVLTNAVQYGAEIAYNANYAQLGETLLIPEQKKQNFTMTYQIGTQKYFFNYNDLKGTWEKGKKYIYNIDINFQEIVITEDVVDWVDELTHPGDGTGTGEVPLS